MTTKQKEKIIRILRKSKLIKCLLGNGCGEHCAVGWLLHEAGVQDHCTAGRGGCSCEEVQLLNDKYGLESGEISGLMQTNDQSEEVERVNRVIGYIQTIPVKDSCGSETTGSK